MLVLTLYQIPRDRASRQQNTPNTSKGAGVLLSNWEGVGENVLSLCYCVGVVCVELYPLDNVTAVNLAAVLYIAGE